METTNQHRLGIVLSGGGSRGIAHIGVLRALEEHGLSPDCIAGISAGAIVGALYAAGYSPPEMLEFFRLKNPFRISKVSIKKPGFIDTAKSVADFEEYFPDDSFESLRKPLRIVATDMITGKAVIFDSGPLIHPVLASSSVPVVFTPTEIDGRWYSDGGIVNNFPVELLEDRCRVLLGVYVGPRREVARSDLRSSFSVLQRALEVGQLVAAEAKFDRCDVLICPAELGRFGVFETKQLKAIEEVGYAAATEALETIRRAL